MMGNQNFQVKRGFPQAGRRERRDEEEEEGGNEENI